MKYYTNSQMFTLFTIGHGTRKIEDFTHLLKSNGIEILIDVRTYPYSRFHVQYRRVQLEHELKNAGIEYLFLGEELGGRPKNPQLYFDGKLNYQTVKKSALFNAGINKVIDLINFGIKVTLMCSESDQNDCHRKHLITDYLNHEEINIIHINKFGLLEKDVRMPELNLFD